MDVKSQLFGLPCLQVFGHVASLERHVGSLLEVDIKSMSDIAAVFRDIGFDCTFCKAGLRVWELELACQTCCLTCGE